MINTIDQYQKFLSQHNVVVDKKVEKKFISILSLTALVPSKKLFIKSIRDNGMRVIMKNRRFYVVDA